MPNHLRNTQKTIVFAFNWTYLAQNYFGKSRSWLYHKFSGRNNGKPDDFSDINRERLKGALVDISNRLRMTADKL